MEDGIPGKTALLGWGGNISAASAVRLRQETRGLTGLAAIMVEERVHPLWLRAGTGDVDRAITMLDLASRGLKCAHEPRRIIEIGAGAGYRAVALAAEYPGCEILAAEADPLLQRTGLLNTLPYDNITYVSAAVSTREAQYGYFGRLGPHGAPALQQHSAGGKIRPAHVLQQCRRVSLRIFNQMQRRRANLAHIMRWNRGCHAHRNARSAISQQVGKRPRQNHRLEVLIRRINHRLEAIARRLEILDGYIKVFLNLDEVIRIIRYEDEPKAVLIKTFELTEVQAEAILNMRLRALRKLEEMEIRNEHKKLSAEQKGLQALLKDEKKRWAKIGEEIAEVKEKFGSGPLGARRTKISAAAPVVESVAEALVEREPSTVILSEKGWIRAQKGHLADDAELKFKEGDKLAHLLRCESIDKIALLATNGRVYTLKGADIPRGRGDGQAIRLMVELANEDGVLRLFVPDAARKYLVASSAGRGFVLPGSELSSERRAGKTILTLKPGEEWAVCVPAEGDHVAVIGENRKLLVFPLDQLPEMPKGAGVQLQKYKDGGLADVKVFALAEGLSWRIGEKTRNETKLTDWMGARASAGRLPPNGFPRGNKFGA